MARALFVFTLLPCVCAATSVVKPSSGWVEFIYWSLLMKACASYSKKRKKKKKKKKSNGLNASNIHGTIHMARGKDGEPEPLIGWCLLSRCSRTYIHNHNVRYSSSIRDESCRVSLPFYFSSTKEEQVLDVVVIFWRYFLMIFLDQKRFSLLLPSSWFSLHSPTQLRYVK